MINYSKMSYCVKYILSILLLFVLFGCAASLKSSGVPDGYSGETAYIEDHIYQESSSKEKWLRLSEQ